MPAKKTSDETQVVVSDPDARLASPEPEAVFDIEKWLAGVTRPTRVIRLIQNTSLAVKVQEAEEKLSTPDIDPRLGGSDNRGALSIELTKLRRAAEASTLKLTVQGLLYDEVAQLRADAAALADPTQEEMSLLLVERCVIDPKITVEQARKLRETINYGQWSELIDTCNELTFESIPADFS